MKVPNQNLFATPRYLWFWLEPHKEKKSLFTQPCPKYLWELDFISPVLMTLAQKEKSEVSTHPAEVISEHHPCPSPGMPQGPAWGALHPAFHWPHIIPTSMVPVPCVISRGDLRDQGAGWLGRRRAALQPPAGFQSFLFIWLL